MPYKVIQWATGAIGKTCLRQIIEHPDLELVGLFVHSPAKVGKDAGEIARRPLTGIKATNSVDEIVALDADVVLHLPLNHAATFEEHDTNIKRLLASGKNVITTVAHTYPYALGAGYAAGFEEACRQGNATLFGTGINPGFLGERLAVMLTGLCTKVDSVIATEAYDVREVRSAGFVFDQMGVGKPLEYHTRGTTVLSVYRHIFSEVVGFVGHALQVDFDEVVEDHEYAVAQKDLVLAAGPVKAGGVVNCRFRWHGMKNGKPFFTIQLLWFCDRSLPGWDVPDGWDIEIKGAPGIRMRLDLVEPEGMPDRSKAMQYHVAAPVLRAIPEVIKAPPGILLPPVFASYSPRMR